MTGILVVDDEAAVSGLFAAALRPQGFTVWLAANGQEAIELYRQHGPEIGLVLLDVRMPGLDGPQTFIVLQQLNAGVRCCFMSGETGAYLEDELRRLGAVAFLSKPIRLDEVLRVLQQFLR